MNWPAISALHRRVNARAAICSGIGLACYLIERANDPLSARCSGISGRQVVACRPHAGKLGASHVGQLQQNLGQCVVSPWREFPAGLRIDQIPCTSPLSRSNPHFPCRWEQSRQELANCSDASASAVAMGNNGLLHSAANPPRQHHGAPGHCSEQVFEVRHSVHFRLPFSRMNPCQSAWIAAARGAKNWIGP